MSLETDLTPAKPFLIKPDVSGAQAKIEQPAEEIKDDAKYFYHATNYKNLQSIKVNGLDPNFGGKGGAGDQVGGADGKHFNTRSGGKVHGTAASSTANFYAVMRDEPTLFVKAYRNIGSLDEKQDPQNLGDFAVILRFRRDIGTWEKDPDDPRNAWRTSDKIQPWCIEALTTEGWKKINHLNALDKALSGT